MHTVGPSEAMIISGICQQFCCSYRVTPKKSSVYLKFKSWYFLLFHLILNIEQIRFFLFWKWAYFLGSPVIFSKGLSIESQNPIYFVLISAHIYNRPLPWLCQYCTHLVSINVFCLCECLLNFLIEQMLLWQYWG